MSTTFTSIGIDRLRIVNDGAGITTLVAGSGCNLRCAYCLNPQCFMGGCPVKTYSAEELIEELKADDLYFQATEGGVVFGGGEPLLQADFIQEFREKAPKEWKIYLESSLVVPKEELEKVIDDIDFFLIDVKDMNPDIYIRYTGKSIDNLKKNLEILAEKVSPDKVTLRIPLIPSYNSPADQQRSVKELKNYGFTSFDVFEYDDLLASNKKESLSKSLPKS